MHRLVVLQFKQTQKGESVYIALFWQESAGMLLGSAGTKPSENDYLFPWQ